MSLQDYTFKSIFCLYLKHLWEQTSQMTLRWSQITKEAQWYSTKDSNISNPAKVNLPCNTDAFTTWRNAAQESSLIEKTWHRWRMKSLIIIPSILVFMKASQFPPSKREPLKESKQTFFKNITKWFSRIFRNWRRINELLKMKINIKLWLLEAQLSSSFNQCFTSYLIRVELFFKWKLKLILYFISFRTVTGKEYFQTHQAHSVDPWKLFIRIQDESLRAVHVETNYWVQMHKVLFAM